MISDPKDSVLKIIDCKNLYMMKQEGWWSFWRNMVCNFRDISEQGCFSLTEDIFASFVISSEVVFIRKHPQNSIGILKAFIGTFYHYSTIIKYLITTCLLFDFMKSKLIFFTFAKSNPLFAWGRGSI